MTSSDAELHLTSLKIEEFLAALASGRPTPGGGSAAALAGATAAALVCMVAELTIGREQYAACQQRMIHVRDDAETLRQRLTALVDEDARAYQDLMLGYSLPRVTEADNAQRTSAIQRALRRASEVPLETAEACGALIELAATGSALGNRNAASDAAVGALLAHAGLRCAVLNVNTNLRTLRDEPFKADVGARLGELQATGDAALAKALTAASLGD